MWQTISAIAEDGSRLWLRYPDTPSPNANISLLKERQYVGNEETIIETAISELRDYWLGLPVTLCLNDDETLESDAFHIIKIEEESFRITASSAMGLLYGVYYMLRSQTMGDGCLCQTLGPSHEMTERPSATKRAISIGNPTLLRLRSTTFARAMASIGVNEVILPSYYLNKEETLNEALQPYGIVISYEDTDMTVLPLTSDANWTGDHLQQFNWYSAGRRLWQTDLTSQRLVCEWLAQTFSENPYFIISMRDAMLSTEDLRLSKLFETWQEMHSYVDPQRHKEVEIRIMEQLTDTK